MHGNKGRGLHKGDEQIERIRKQRRIIEKGRRHNVMKGKNELTKR